MVSAFASPGISKLQELLLCSRLQLTRLLFAPCSRMCWRVFIRCFVLVLRLVCRDGLHRRCVGVVAVRLLQHVVIELKEEERCQKEKV